MNLWVIHLSCQIYWPLILLYLLWPYAKKFCVTDTTGSIDRRRFGCHQGVLRQTHIPRTLGREARLSQIQHSEKSLHYYWYWKRIIIRSNSWPTLLRLILKLWICKQLAGLLLGGRPLARPVLRRTLEYRNFQIWIRSSKCIRTGDPSPKAAWASHVHCCTSISTVNVFLIPKHGQTKRDLK